ncbi:MAG: hypothetical protein AAGG38_06235 [Planctomycetota bacterium]
MTSEIEYHPDEAKQLTEELCAAISRPLPKVDWNRWQWYDDNHEVLLFGRPLDSDATDPHDGEVAHDWPVMYFVEQHMVLLGGTESQVQEEATHVAD